MTQQLATTRVAGTSEQPTTEQIVEFRAALTRKYDGVSDRELMELAAHNSEMTRADVARVLQAVGPAMEKLAKGGLMALFKG